MQLSQSSQANPVAILEQILPRPHPLSWAVACMLYAMAMPANAEAPVVLPAVTVSSSGLAVPLLDMGTPTEVLEGDALVHTRAATLGETLNGLPGVHSSHFGAGASRPVIRGMDGPRVKVLSDGSETHDASTVSPDHAVVVDPLLSSQIEVLRGPFALLYGGAVGGVVNVLDHKIPTTRPSAPLSGVAEWRYGTAAQESAGAFALTGESGPLVLRVEGAARDAEDYRVGSGWSERRRVHGSASKGQSGSVGLSWVKENGYIGLAYTRQQSRYGLPGHSHDLEGCHTHGNHLHCGAHGHTHAEPNDAHAHNEHHDHHDHHAKGDVPVVDLRSNRWDLRGEWRQPLVGIETLRLRASHTRYAHDEIAHGETETQFRNRAHDVRVEMQHASVRGWSGVIGLQTGGRRFSAEGEEEYVPPTETDRWGIFWLEHFTHGAWRWQAALRHDRQTVALQDGQLKRKHSGTSASLGTVWTLQPGWQASMSYTQAQRLPTAEELYAKGLHMATRTYERGDANLGRETSQAWDLGLRAVAGSTTWQINVFQHRVKGYIYGQTLDALDGLQLLQYTQSNARFTGLEAQVNQRLNAHWSVTVFGDAVRARLADGNALPRIPSARAGLRVNGQWGPWSGQAEWVQVASQNRVAAYESRTAGYGMLNLGASRHWRSVAGMDWYFYVKASNLTNRLAFAHTSFIKRDAPLQGRNVTAGLRATF